LISPKIVQRRGEESFGSRVKNLGKLALFLQGKDFLVALVKKKSSQASSLGLGRGRRPYANEFAINEELWELPLAASLVHLLAFRIIARYVEALVLDFLRVKHEDEGLLVLLDRQRRGGRGYEEFDGHSGTGLLVGD